MTDVIRPGIIYYNNENNQDKLETCELLKGKIIKGLSKSHSDELLAFDDESVYTIITGKVVDQNSYVKISSNGKNITLLSLNKVIYIHGVKGLKAN